jgi:hypothetical protein
METPFAGGFGGDLMTGFATNACARERPVLQDACLPRSTRQFLFYKGNGLGEMSQGTIIQRQSVLARGWPPRAAPLLKLTRYFNLIGGHSGIVPMFGP